MFENYVTPPGPKVRTASNTLLRAEMPFGPHPCVNVTLGSSVMLCRRGLWDGPPRNPFDLMRVGRFVEYVGIIRFQKQLGAPVMKKTKPKPRPRPRPPKY